MQKITAITLIALAALTGAQMTLSPAGAQTVIYCNADGLPAGCVATTTTTTVVAPRVRPHPVAPRSVDVDVYRAPATAAGTPAGRAARAAGPGPGRNYGGPVNRPGRF